MKQVPEVEFALKICTGECLCFLDSVYCGRSQPVLTVEDVYEEVYINNTVFRDNSYNFIKASGIVRELNIINCLFAGSTRDGGVHVSSQSENVILADSIFTNCARTSLLLSSTQSNSSIAIMNCNFINNRAPNGTEESAIVINAAVSATISNCLFLNNSGGGANDSR